MSAITRQRLNALLSEAEVRELRKLAIDEGVTVESLTGWIIRYYLGQKGLPIEGSVKA